MTKLKACTVIRFSSAFKIKYGLLLTDHGVIYITGNPPAGSIDYMDMDYRILND